jgi:hypothetical protein
MKAKSKVESPKNKMLVQKIGTKAGTSESGAKASWGFMTTKQGIGDKKGKGRLHESQVLQL